MIQKILYLVYIPQRMAEYDPKHIYIRIIDEFTKLLSIAGLDGRKDDGKSRREEKLRSISFRRFVKTVISDQTNQDFGHRSQS